MVESVTIPILTKIAENRAGNRRKSALPRQISAFKPSGLESTGLFGLRVRRKSHPRHHRSQPHRRPWKIRSRVSRILQFFSPDLSQRLSLPLWYLSLFPESLPLSDLPHSLNFSCGLSHSLTRSVSDERKKERAKKNRRTEEKRKEKEIRKGEERVRKPGKGEERSCVFFYIGRMFLL
jgi:hypothetical protein